MPKFKCLRCGHGWMPRTDREPMCCPSCKSYKWNKAPANKEKEGKEG